MFDADTMQALILAAIRTKGLTTARTIQSDKGIIGPSDLGFCRQKATLMTRGVESTDSSNHLWAAQVGTAIHEYVGDALKAVYPTWLIEERVTATFPSGAAVSGSSDIIVPEWNCVLDIKTVDGFEKIKRFGVSQNHRYQRHTYALGAIQAGLLDGDRPVYVGNVYLDRSGQETVPYLVVDEYDPLLTLEVDQWISDVIYAVTNNEDAMRDVAAPVCERICEFYTVCRGDLPTSENEVIDTPEVLEAVTLYVEGREAKAQADKQMDQAKTILSGLNGVVGGWQVRTTEIGETEVPGFTRRASIRLDVRRTKGAPA